MQRKPFGVAVCEQVGKFLGIAETTHCILESLFFRDAFLLLFKGVLQMAEQFVLYLLAKFDIIGQGFRTQP
ncbi:MAG: hypothetical protein II943_01975 [Victivallales bacterium]|nr:hypothetical protein [Victivallales bacterium]